MHRIQEVETLLIAIVLAIGGTVLLGWLVPSLGAALPAGWSVMKANTSLSLLLCAMSLLLSRKGAGASLRSVSRIPAGLVLLLFGAALFEHASGQTSGFSEIIASDRDASSPGLMSFQTAFCLGLMAVVLLIGLEHAGRLGDVLDSILGALVTVCIVLVASLMLGADSLLGQSTTTRTSTHTLVCLVFLMIAVVGRRAPHGALSVLVGTGVGSRFVRIVLPIVLVTPLLVLLATDALNESIGLPAPFGVALAAAGVTSLLLMASLLLADSFNRSERAIGEAQALRDAVLDGVSHAIITGDERGIVHFSRGAEQLLGYRTEEVVGRHTAVRFHDPEEVAGRAAEVSAELGHDIPADFDVLVAGARAGGREERKWTYIRKDGTRVPVLLSVTALRDLAGEITSFIMVAQDYTLQKEVERAQLRANVTMAEALTRAEYSDLAKSTFLATMSHEFRTPLNAIIGFTGIVLHGLPGPLTDEQRRQLGMVAMSAQHLLSLINDVLDISRIEAGELQLHLETFDGIDSLKRTMAMVLPAAESKGLAVHLDLDEVSPTTVLHADKRRFEQVLLNLLGNAIKFTERGSITLNARSDAGRLTVSVADTGIGIRPEDQARLFEPFRQLDTGLKKGHEGTGLGLAISHRLAGLMGGTLTLESQPGVGTTFSLVLPQERSSA